MLSTRRKRLQVQVLFDREASSQLLWNPEHDKDFKQLDALWQSLTKEEKADLRRWLEEKRLL